MKSKKVGIKFKGRLSLEAEIIEESVIGVFILVLEMGDLFCMNRVFVQCTHQTFKVLPSYLQSGVSLKSEDRTHRKLDK